MMLIVKQAVISNFNLDKLTSDYQDNGLVKIAGLKEVQKIKIFDVIR